MKKILIFISLLFSLTVKSQIDISELKYDYLTQDKFEKYIKANHEFQQNFTTWKDENKMQYFKELWYYSKSFSIERSHFSQGFTLDESMIDIGRFESYRKQDEYSIVEIPGSKDVIVLLPINKLIYKP